MDAIKKKMTMLKDKLKQAEDEAQEAEDELDGKQHEADEAEADVISKTSELNDIEGDVENAEDRFMELKGKYDEAIKIQDENERAHKELSNRGQVDTVKLDRLEREIADLQDMIADVDNGCLDAATKLEEAEGKLEDEEERFSVSDGRVRELEVESVQVSNLLRSMEINEDNAAKSQSSSSNKVDETRDRVDDITRLAQEKEEDASQLEKALGDQDQDVTDVRERYLQVKSDYDALLAEVAEI